MTVTEKNDAVIVEGVKDFDLDHIFDCGQCFRWERHDDGAYLGTARGRQALMSYDSSGQELTIYGADKDDFEEVWRDYLDLDRDYGAIKAELAAGDPVMSRAISFGSGIRILKQEKWETLLSFIISQNNNIPRIKKCIESLAQTMGRPSGEFMSRQFYALPDPERLAGASVDDLAPCRLGYRARYLIDTARQVAEEGLESLERLGTEEVSSQEAFDALLGYCGVGPKVANCIALFSMNKLDRFPIDVWVRKVMHRLYGIEENDMKRMAAFAADNFGHYGGIAQQYLFYYITHCKEI